MRSKPKPTESEGAGRAPVTLLIALFASLALHAAALFLPEFDLERESLLPLLLAEFRPAPLENLAEPKPPATRQPERTWKTPRTQKMPGRASPGKKNPPVLAVPVLPIVPIPSTPNAEPFVLPALPEAESTESAESMKAGGYPMGASADPITETERLPPGGRIRFRVDWGDSGFEIGFVRQEWRFQAGRYQLVSLVETNGLAWLLRSVSVDMESTGRVTDEGLLPDVFGVRRSGQRARERALFDWESLRVRVSNGRDYTLDRGAQDLLSFYYQLGFLKIAPGQTATIALATGRKYAVYRLENLGDEIIDVPLGRLRARHLRGENAAEIWLAYEYHLLPVKIRHLDNKGNAFVQTATRIEYQIPHQ